MASRWDRRPRFSDLGGKPYGGRVPISHQYDLQLIKMPKTRALKLFVTEDVALSLSAKSKFLAVAFKSGDSRLKRGFAAPHALPPLQ